MKIIEKLKEILVQQDIDLKEYMWSKILLKTRK